MFADTEGNRFALQPTGHEPGSARHDLEDPGNDRLRVRS
jgi:hypothetical protein